MPYRQEGGAQGRRGACKECFKAARRASWAKDPKVQARRRQILERWRGEGLSGKFTIRIDRVAALWNGIGSALFCR